MTQDTIAAQIEAMMARVDRSNAALAALHEKYPEPAEEGEPDRGFRAASYECDVARALLSHAAVDALPAIVTALRQAEAAPGVVESINAQEPREREVRPCFLPVACSRNYLGMCSCYDDTLPKTTPPSADAAMVEAASAKAEARFAEHSPVMSEIINRAISLYRFDTPADKSRTHEVARIVARNVDLASHQPTGVDASKYENMETDQKANAMADDCVGDPWELLGYFREKLKQSQWEADHARAGALDLAKRLAALKRTAAPATDEGVLK